MTIENTTRADLTLVYRFFDESIRYQESRGYPVWKHYDKQALIRDVEEGNQYKIVKDSEVAMVFSVCYADAVIWRAREKGDAVYLHRIVVNPSFKGQKLFGQILDWAVMHARVRRLNYVRMDTWAANPVIIDYYKSFGFGFVENFTTPDNEALPVHNRNLALALLEYSVLS